MACIFMKLKNSLNCIEKLKTNDITSDDLPKDIAFKLANETEKMKSVTQAPQVIISSIIKRKDPKII